MVEKSMQSSRMTMPPAGLVPVPSVLYGITAVRMEGSQIAEVMMGMIDPGLQQWDLRPAPTRLVEVVDRLVEGDTVVTLFPTERGTLQMGSQVKVDVLPEGTETLAAAEERPGRRLTDLPRF
ncbi:hypothetical protein JJ685_06090 [Ramlibacter monticola]|uniref:Uncharacterized protein n=1 Tax=Ramlibacter monticola TaxID=1926872 RepID=A0A936YY25_9BURK|nr:hypothetical protein [Ramlibacter monticola]MBL0390711.1 hypothetical protein [Ramlibacter monticola]